MATSPNFSWPEPDNTDLVKNGALAIRTAVNAIDSSMAELKGGTTGQVLSKTSATDMDFTWATPAVSGAMTLITRSSFSNVASVTYDSVFSSTYGSYLIVFETFYAATETDDILMQLRYGSTTETSTTYRYVSISTASNTSTVTGLNSGSGISSWMLADQSGNATEPTRGHFIIPNAGVAGVAAINGQLANISASRYSNFNGSLYTSRTYTGFIVASSASNITGTIAIYGMKVA